MDNEQYLREVTGALERDNTRLGDVWTHDKNEKSPDDIAQELGVATSGFVHTYKRYTRIIRDGDIPETPTLARQAGGALRGFLRRHRDFLSEDTRLILEERAEKCDLRATDAQALDREDAAVERQTAEFEESDLAGIYVYTYPHYYSYPVAPQKDDSDDRTYLKVGMSKRDVSERIAIQTTGMPESAKVLQVWLTENECDLKEIEGKIHEHLRTVGHGKPGSKRKEWFLTNEDSVASTATLLGLTCKFDHRETLTVR